MVDVSGRIKMFHEARAPFIAAGFPIEDLLPIIPPGAPIGAQSVIKPQHIGKVPGRFRRGEWVGLTGDWPSKGLDTDTLAVCGRWETDSVGLRAANWPGLDIDVEDEALVTEIIRIAHRILGFGPCRGRDVMGSPRRLIMYEADGEIRKPRLVFNVGGTEHAVELLAAGQQYVIAGQHPKGGEYKWTELPDPQKLERIYPALVDAFFIELETFLVQRGAVIVTNRTGGAAGPGTDYTKIKPVMSADLALSALRAVPNTQENFPNREDLIAMLASFKAAVGADAENHYHDVAAWATEHGWADEEYVAKVWNSLHEVRATPAYLLNRARRQGWHLDAKDDFPDDQPTEGSSWTKPPANTLEEIAAGLAYLPSSETWIELTTGTYYAHSALNNSSIGLKIAPAGTRGSKSPTNQLLNSGYVRSVIGVTYVAGEPSLVTTTVDGRTGLWFNRYKPSTLDVPDRHVEDHEIEPFLDLLRRLHGDEIVRDLYLDWMAYRLQYPKAKIRWAPLVLGRQGIGKDTLLKPLIAGLGQQNVSEISPFQLTAKFNARWIDSQLVVVQEMVRTERAETYDMIKAYVSGTGADTIMVEEKFKEPRPVPNRTAFVFFTNNDDAVSLSRDDRRFFVLRADLEEPLPPGYYHALHDWYAKGGLGLVVRWLLQRDVSKLDVNSAPLYTAAKEDMIVDSLNAGARWLYDGIREGRHTGRTVLSTSDLVREIEQGPHPSYASPKTVAKAMRVLGWHRYGESVEVKGVRKRLWTSDAELAKNPKALVARLLEEEKKLADEFDNARR